MRRIVLTAVLLLALGIFLGAQSGICQSEGGQPDAAMLMASLEKVLENQAQILSELEKIQEELEVVKIRATKR